jgi:peptidoglycan-associated lipoprotein
MQRLLAVILGGLGVLDLAYIDLVAGPRTLGLHLEPRTSRAGASGPAQTVGSMRTAPVAAVAAPTTVAAPIPPVAAPTPVAAPVPLVAAPALVSGDPGLLVKPVEGVEAPVDRRWTVKFTEAGEAVVSDAAVRQLRLIASKYASSHALRVRIVGHADDRGNSVYNRILGERRARAVADALLAAGFSAAQVEVLSEGEDDPKALGAGEETWAENRRAEIEIQARRSQNP